MSLNPKLRETIDRRAALALVPSVLAIGASGVHAVRYLPIQQQKEIRDQALVAIGKDPKILACLDKEQLADLHRAQSYLATPRTSFIMRKPPEPNLRYIEFVNPEGRLIEKIRITTNKGGLGAHLNPADLNLVTKLPVNALLAESLFRFLYGYIAAVSGFANEQDENSFAGLDTEKPEGEPADFGAVTAIHLMQFWVENIVNLEHGDKVTKIHEQVDNDRNLLAMLKQSKFIGRFGNRIRIEVPQGKQQADGSSFVVGKLGMLLSPILTALGGIASYNRGANILHRNPIRTRRPRQS